MFAIDNLINNKINLNRKYLKHIEHILFISDGIKIWFKPSEIFRPYNEDTKEIQAYKQLGFRILQTKTLCLYIPSHRNKIYVNKSILQYPKLKRKLKRYIKQDLNIKKSRSFISELIHTGNNQ